MKVDEINKIHQIQQVMAVRDWSSLKLNWHLQDLKDVHIYGARIWDQFGSIYFFTLTTTTHLSGSAINITKQKLYFLYLI